MVCVGVVEWCGVWVGGLLGGGGGVGGGRISKTYLIIGGVRNNWGGCRFSEIDIIYITL